MISGKIRRLLAGAMLGLLFTALPVSAQTSNAPAIVRQGYALLNRGWVDDAIDTFRQALQTYPQSLDAKLGLAIAYQKAGRDTDAWQAYQQVLTQAPSNRAALTAVGQLGSYRPEWQQGGIAALTTLLELTPTDTAARAQRAQLYAYQSQFAEAIADYEILLSAVPAPEVLLGAAQAYTYSGDYQQGVALFDRYQASGKPIPDSAATAYAFALQQAGNPKAAIQLLEPRLKPTLDEMSIQIRAALASAYAADRQIQQAITTLEPLQDRPEAVLPLARSLSSIGRQAQDEILYEGAVLLYQRVLQQTPSPSAALLIEAADVLSDAPDHQAQALQLYEQALALQTDNPSVQVKQLVLQQQLGQISRADLQQQLKTLLGGLPTEAGEQRSLALALLRIDPPNSEFLPLFQAALQNGADVPFFNFRIAQIYLQQNNLAAARTAVSAYGATPVGTQDPATEFLLAEIDRLEGNLDGSAQRYQTVIDRSLGDEVTRDATRGLAGIRLAQAQPAAALQLYKQLLAANPKDAVSQLGEAAIAYQLQQISEADATAILNRWQQTQPRSVTPPELFTLVGVLPANPQREAIYDRLLEADPYNIPVNLRWVQLWATRDPDQAKARVEQLLATDRIGAYFVQGELGQTLGDLTLAAQSYEAILAAQPDNPNALSALGGVRFEQRRFDDAVALYSRVLELRPNDVETRRILAELNLAQDRPFTALQELQNLQRSDPSSDPAANPATAERIERLQVDILRRRGFQPYWERY